MTFFSVSVSYYFIVPRTILRFSLTISRSFGKILSCIQDTVVELPVYRPLRKAYSLAGLVISIKVSLLLL